jgi:uncharacterized surface protein with fasciclin (FAS1) repeats
VVKLNGAKTVNGQLADISVADGAVRVDGAKVIATDIDASNGVIHVIDSVITPSTDDLVATAVKAGSFSTLAAAVKAAGLVETLKTGGPFTVFAPTDEAFGKLPAGTVATLLQPENLGKLQAILKYHVVPGRVYASDAIAAKTAKTLEGNPLRVKAKGKSVRINDATVVKANIDASNGVIHVIDSVLLPDTGEARAPASPRGMILTSISKGSALYNSGHHGECADLYEATAKKLMSADGMCPVVKTHVATALEKSEKTHCATTRAWTMRHALDMALSSMPEK